MTAERVSVTAFSVGSGCRGGFAIAAVADAGVWAEEPGEGFSSDPEEVKRAVQTFTRAYCSLCKAVLLHRSGRQELLIYLQAIFTSL